MPRSTVGLYLHPIGGLVTIALAVYTATLGFRGRRPHRDRERIRRRHATVGPLLYALVLVDWLAGMVTVHWLAPDLEEAATTHELVGTLLVLLFTLAAFLSRWVPVDPRARAVHPLLGAAAVLLSGFQIFLGLQLLP